MKKTSTAFDIVEGQNFTPPANSVLVSIISPHRQEFGTPLILKFRPEWIEILNMRFDDVHLGEYGCITPAQARNISDFIFKHWDKNIYTHCFAGRSRSAGVCAILEMLGWEVHWRMQHAPSHAVKTLIMREVERHPDFERRTGRILQRETKHGLQWD